jgi:hypothetical protein
MRFEKLGLISIVFFFLLLTAMSLLLPSATNISRAIDINAPADTVYNYINDFSNWKYWYADYNSSEAIVSSATRGKGAMLIMNKTTVIINEASPAKIKAFWQRDKSNPLPGEFVFITNDGASNVTLQWRFVQKVKWYPWQKLSSIASNKVIGSFMEKSLEKLKREVEEKAR